MPSPFQIGQKLAQANKPLPPMNTVPTPVQQIQTGYASGKK
jgi:hypothetical protein